MADKLPEYKIFAIRYATRDARRADHFIGGDPHDGPMPMDYFTWVAISAARSFVIDSGFTAEMAVKRGRRFLGVERRNASCGRRGRQREAHRLLQAATFRHVLIPLNKRIVRQTSRGAPCIPVRKPLPGVRLQDLGAH